MVKTAISPNFFSDPEISPNKVLMEKLEIHEFNLDINLKIAIYEDRVNGWFLEIAQGLKENPHAGFVILMIAISHLEGIQQFKMGKRTTPQESKNAIKDCLKEIFVISSEYDNILDVLVEDCRHGLFHDGMTRKRISISDSSAHAIFVREQGRILINPHLFLDIIHNDFNRYIARLKDPLNKEERENFEKIWDDMNLEKMPQNENNTKINTEDIQSNI